MDRDQLERLCKRAKLRGGTKKRLLDAFDEENGTPATGGSEPASDSRSGRGHGAPGDNDTPLTEY